MVDKDERQIQSLIRLIDDMLDVSRIRTGKLSIRPSRTDLAQLVGNVVENFSAQMEACGCELRLERNEPIAGVWDAFRIEQVLANLLTNAMRYGAGKPVQVSVTSCTEGACIEVRDHGIGISPKSLERIFCQFERAEGSESSAGLGLGLFIADQIVRAHNGRIQVQSEEGQGSLFRVLLPLGE
jgi:signal transduction histidine kinase